MSLSLSIDQLLRLRLRAQRLGEPGSGLPTDPKQAVKAVCGVQAQDQTAALLSLGVRSTGLTAARVEAARQVDRTLIRTWCQRGTLHLVDADDAAWLVPFLGPTFIALGGRRFKQLGWDEDATRTGLGLVRGALAGRGPLTRPEVAALLGAAGLPSEGQAPYHLIYRAALECILCQGPDRGKEPTYVLWEDWIGPARPLPRGDALAALARRYLEAYGPAGPPDLASWSGLKLAEARQAWELIAAEIVPVEAAGQPAGMLKTHLPWLDDPPPASPLVRLLPKFDTYLLGYANRELVVSPAYARRIHPGGGIIHPTLIVDGQARGTWKTRRSRRSLEVIVAPFETLPAELLPALEAEVARLGRFLELDAALTLESV